MRKLAITLAACAAFLAPAALAAPVVAPREGDFVARDFKFRSGETLPSCGCTTPPSASPGATPPAT